MPDVNTEITISTLCHKVVELEAKIANLQTEVKRLTEDLQAADKRGGLNRSKAIDLANLIEGHARDLTLRAAGRLRSEF